MIFFLMEQKPAGSQHGKIKQGNCIIRINWYLFDRI